MVLRLNRKQLGELIEDIEAKGNDATALREELAALGPEDKPGPSRRGLRSEDREETSEERLIRRKGHLFPGGTPPFKEIYDCDYRFSKDELIEQCRKAGIGVSGDKHDLAAELIAKGADVKFDGEETMKDSTDEKGIWGQIEGTLVEEDLRRAIVGLLYKFYKKRPERFQKYEKLGNIPSKDMVSLLGEYSEMVLEELKAQGGPTKAPIEVTKAAEESLKTIIDLYGEDEENNRRKAPLYPHVPKRQERLFPHTPHSR